MILLVRGKPGAPTGTLTFGSQTIPCALGRSGIIPNEEKTEGDGATPAGTWPLRHVLFRPDRLGEPKTKLSTKPIALADGWCDDPADPRYNRPVDLPYSASTEDMWREDELYNLCVVLGHNDGPIVPNKGSAIFFHVAKEKEGKLCATEGCVALPQDDIIRVLTTCGPGSSIKIELEK